MPISNVTVVQGSPITVEISRTAVSQVANANVANYATNVLGNSQPNITSVGNLTNLIVSGNLTVGGNLNANIVAANANYAIFAGTAYSVDGANVSGQVANANYAEYANNVSGAIANANYAAYAGNAYAVDGANVVGDVANANYANIAGTAYAVDAANVSGIVANANYANIAGTAYSVDGANVSGDVANANYANTAGSATTAGTVTTNAQPNITSVGTLTSLDISGNITANNLGNISEYNLDGNAANVLHGDGSWSSDITDYGNANVANYLPTYTGNLSAGNANLGNLVEANYFSGDGGLLSNITTANANYANFAGTAYAVDGANVSGDVANANYANFAGTAYAVDGANVSGDVANANYANIAGTAYAVDGANVSGTVANANYAAQAGSANTANSATTAGTVTTNAQPNITSVGTLTDLSVTGNTSTGNLLTDNLLYANGNAWTFGGTPGGSNTEVQYNDAGNFAGSAAFTFDNATNTVSATNISANGLTVDSASAITITGNTSAVEIKSEDNGVEIAGYDNGSGTYVNLRAATASGEHLVEMVDAGVLITPFDGAVGTFTFGNGYLEFPDSTQQTTAFDGNANIANTAYSVDGANVVGEVANANYASYAGNAFAIDGANVSGTVANANYANIAGTAYAVDGANVSGTVANANYSAYSGNAYAVDGANVSGTVANANYAAYAGNAYSVDGANVVGEVAVANTVSNPTQSNITTVGTLTNLSVAGNVTANVITANYINANVSFANVDYIDFDTTANAPAHQTGRMHWDAEKGTVDIDMLGSISQQIGEDQYIYVKANANLTAGRVAQFVGVQGDTILAQHANTSNPGFIPRYVIGVIPQDIGVGNFGYVQTFGAIYDIDTNGLATGSILYLSANTDGLLTATEPTSPNPKIVLAASLLESASPATNGRLQVRPDFGYYMNQLHDVSTNAATNGDVYVYDGNVWQPSNTVPVANVAGTVTTNAQPNITSVGNLTALTVDSTSAITILGNTSAVEIKSEDNGVEIAGYDNGSGTYVNLRAATASGEHLIEMVDAGVLITPFDGSVGTFTFGNGYLEFPDSTQQSTAFTGLGGSNTQLQFNDNGNLGGIANVTWNGTDLSLGSVANVKITGGNANQVLQTDGAGNLSFVDQSGGGGGTPTEIVNGNSNVVVYANANIAISSNAVANVMVVTDSKVELGTNVAIQTANLVLIGNNTGNLSAGANGHIAIGSNAGLGTYGNAQSIAIGYNTGNIAVNDYTVAIGYDVGRNQAARAIAIGSDSGFTQATSAIAIGVLAGQNQVQRAIAIGDSAGKTSQGEGCIAIGWQAGQNSQAIGALAIGPYAGMSSGQYTVAVGQGAGSVGQQTRGTAVGVGAGGSNQGQYATALGPECAPNFQGKEAVAVGRTAQYAYAGERAIAIGMEAAWWRQGQYSIAIGYRAAFGDQSGNVTGIGNNSIILNATGANLNNINANTFTVKPIRNANTANVLYYNESTGEITYDTAPSGGGSPGGSNTQLQFNDAGSFGGIANVTWDGTNLSLGAIGNVKITGGNANQILQTDGAGNLTFVDPSTGGTPGGSNTEIQYNDAGNFAGSAAFTFNNTTNTLAVTNITGNGLTIDSTSAITVIGNTSAVEIKAEDNGVEIAGYDNGSGTYVNLRAATASGEHLIEMVDAGVLITPFDGAVGTFTFGNGYLQFPDSTQQTTAFTGLSGTSLLGYKFQSNVTMADPGTGNIRFDSATVASITAMAIDETNFNGANVEFTLRQAFENKGQILSIKADGQTSPYVFKTTGLTNNTGWVEVALTYISGPATVPSADAKLDFFVTYDPLGYVVGNTTTSGTATVGNLSTGGTVTANGNITGGNLIANGILDINGTGNSSIDGNLILQRGLTVYGNTGSGVGQMTQPTVSVAGNVQATNFRSLVAASSIDPTGGNTYEPDPAAQSHNVTISTGNGNIDVDAGFLAAANTYSQYAIQVINNSGNTSVVTLTSINNSTTVSQSLLNGDKVLLIVHNINNEVWGQKIF